MWGRCGAINPSVCQNLHADLLVGGRANWNGMSPISWPSLTRDDVRSLGARGTLQAPWKVLRTPSTSSSFALSTSSSNAPLSSSQETSSSSSSYESFLQSFHPSPPNPPCLLPYHNCFLNLQVQLLQIWFPLSTCCLTITIHATLLTSSRICLVKGTPLHVSEKLDKHVVSLRTMVQQTITYPSSMQCFFYFRRSIPFINIITTTTTTIKLVMEMHLLLMSS